MTHRITAHPETVHIRDYQSADEQSWLRCRVLAFLNTCYYDSVEPIKPVVDDADRTIDLVAVADDIVVGILDVAVRGDLATIETVAVHPDYRRRGIADSLLDVILTRLDGTGVISLDAWTREDAEALAWYDREGFVQTEQYLHVYSGYDRATKLATPTGPSHPVMLFAHAKIEHEARFRSEFERVYICRRMQRSPAR